MTNDEATSLSLHEDPTIFEHKPSAGEAEPMCRDLQARLRVLGINPMFAGMPSETQALVASIMNERSVASGQEIFRENDEATALFAVLAGEVRLVIGGIDGRRHILCHLCPGEMFGETAVFDGQRQSNSALAVTKCRLLLLERRQLLTLIKHQPVVALGFIGVLCQRLRFANAKMESLLFRDLTERLARVLLVLVQGKTAFTINITQAELGELTGVSREAVNKKLRVWQAAGLVAVQPGRVTLLEPVALQEMFQ